MKALLLVDIQNDFLSHGPLGVPEGEQVVPVANRVMPLFPLVVTSQDWHPADHGSFASQHPGREVGERIELDGLEQILWPDHCIQHTPGAEFAPGLETKSIDRAFQKGTDPRIDSYSAFFDNAHRKSTGLGDFLKDQGVDEVFLLGLATDYCVKFSALDARRLGFDVTVIEDGCRGIELQKGDVERALAEIRAAGGRVIRSEELRASACD